MKQIEIVNNFPCKEHTDYWQCDFIPQLGIAGDDQGYAIGIGWLFWTFIINFPKWE